MKNDCKNPLTKTLPEWSAEKLCNFRPLLFGAIFLAVGILFSYAVLVRGVSPWLALIPLIVLTASVLLSIYKLRALFRVVVLCICAVVGFFAFLIPLRVYQSLPVLHGEYAVSGVVDECYVYGETQKLLLGDLVVDGKATDGKMVVWVQGGNAQLSSKVSFRAQLTTNDVIQNDGRFLAEEVSRKIRYQANSVTDFTVTGNVFHLFRAVRARVQTVLQYGMSEESSAVAYALLTGDTSLMEKDFLSNFRYGGVAHLFAVSGLHIGAIFAVCARVFQTKKARKIPKVVRFLVVATLLIFYGGICGYSPSVLRATVTCLAFYGYTLLGKRGDGLERIGLAMLFVLTVQPVLLFSVGFLLSFSACFGIALLYRPIFKCFSLFEFACTRLVRTLFHRRDELDERPLLERADFSSRDLPPSITERIRRVVTSFLSVSASAQLATMPISLLAFGYLPTLGLFLNGIFVPILSATYSILLAFVAIACLLPSVCATVVLYLPSTVLSALLITFFVVDFSALTVTVAMPVTAIVVYYLGLLTFTDKWNVSKRFQRVVSVTFWTVFLVLLFLVNV